MAVDEVRSVDLGDAVGAREDHGPNVGIHPVLSCDLVAPYSSVAGYEYPVLLVHAESVEKVYILGFSRDLSHERVADVVDVARMPAFKLVCDAEDVLVDEDPVERGMRCHQDRSGNAGASQGVIDHFVGDAPEVLDVLFRLAGR